MKKISKAYKTIGEVAEILELESSGDKKNTHTIRYWESEFKQIKPIIINKRRHYDVRSINLLKKIKYLLKEKGMTLIGVKKVLKSEDSNIAEMYNTTIRQNNIDPKITNKIWKNMIYAYIDFERRNFTKKK